jgi:catecholate siderophore receptor
MRRLPIMISIFALAATTPAYAEDAQIEGQTIIVTGKVDGYRTVDTTSGTKTNTPILDVPQTINVVTEEQIRDQAIRSVSDLVRLLPGVSAGQGEGHRDQITLRGNNSTADFFVDGLRDDVQYFRSFYNIDRVEVHKGANAMVFGRGGGGGVVNRITKGALLGENQAQATASVDSFGSWYGAVDGNVGLGTMAALRLNGFYEAVDNHRDAYGGNHWGINPTVAAQIGDRAKLQLGYEYVRDDRVVDRGIPSAFLGTIATPAAPLAGFRDSFFGVRGVNDSAFDAHMLRFRSEVDLGSGLNWSTQALYGDYDKAYTNAYAATAVGTPLTGPLAGVPSLGIEAYSDLTDRRSFIGQTNLEWRGKTGGIDHVILLGAEYTDQDTLNERINGFFAAGALTSNSNRRVQVTLGRPPVIPAITFVAGPTGNSNRQVKSALSQYSVYLQNQIGITDYVDVIAGIRYDRLKIGVGNLFTATRVERVDDLWSPRVGLVVKPVPEASIYASWAKSFLPQSGDQFLTFDATNAALEPEAFDNYEVGAKWDIMPGLSLAAAVYRLDRTNTRAAGPTPGSIVLTGGQRTEGYEISLVGKITPQWQTAMAFAHTKAVIASTTTAAPAGRVVGQVPRNQLSLWNRYDVSDRVGVGLGLSHQSSQFASISNVTRLPAYTRIDAALFVKLTERISAQINVENIGNITYFPVAHNDNNISPGAPRNVRLTISTKF